MLRLFHRAVVVFVALDGSEPMEKRLEVTDSPDEKTDGRDGAGDSGEDDVEEPPIRPPAVGPLNEQLPHANRDERGKEEEDPGEFEVVDDLITFGKLRARQQCPPASCWRHDMIGPLGCFRLILSALKEPVGVQFRVVREQGK